MADGKSKKRRKAAARRKIILLAVLCLVVVIALVIGAVLFLKADKTPTLAFTELPFLASDQHIYVGTGFYYASNGTIGYHDLKDAKESYTLSVSSYGLQLAASRGLAVVYNGSAIQIVGSQYPVNCPAPIQLVECGRSHVVVLCRNEATAAETLLVYDNSGVQTDQIEPGSGFFVNFGFTDTEKDMLWVQTTDITGSVPVTTITTYDLDSNTTTGVIQVQRQMIDQFLSSRSGLFAVGTNHIIRYNASGKESYRETIYGWRVLDHSFADGASFLLTPRASEKMSAVKLCRLAENDVSNRQDTYLQLPPETIAVCLINNKLTVVTQTEIYVYSSKGVKSSTYKLEQPIVAAERLNDSQLMVSCHNGQSFIVSL